MKNKGYTILNIAGLSVGMATCLLLLLYVKDEYSYNKFLNDSDRIYRVLFNEHLPGAPVTTSKRNPAPLQKVFEENLPGVESTVQMTSKMDLVLQVEEKGFNAAGYMVSDGFFRTLRFPLIEGNEEGLKSPQGVYLSESLSDKLFDTVHATGSILKIPDWGTYKVLGVFESIPTNSTLQFDFVMPIQKWLERTPDAQFWGNRFVEHYIKLKANVNPETFLSKTNAVFKERNPESTSLVKIQRYEEEYLYDNFVNGEASGGRIVYVNLFTAVAIFILILGCINFMNLVTARSSRRAKEVGVKKVVGSSRVQLAAQFLVESVTTSFVAIFVAVIMVLLSLPTVNGFLEKEMSFPLTNYVNLLLLIGGGILIGILAGVYPALILSSFAPNRVLKGSFKTSAWSSGIRKTLVVFQFLISIAMIIATMVVHQQISYIRNMNLGYEKENLIYVPLKGELRETARLELLKNQLLLNPDIISVSASDNPLLDKNSWTTGGFSWNEKDTESDMAFQVLQVSGDYSETLKISMKEGRDFDPDIALDANNVLINEATARVMNIEEPLGKSVFFWGRRGKIIGIVKDFHFATVYKEIQPLVISLRPENSRFLLARINGGNREQTVKSIEAVHKALAPDYPFEYHFMDQAYDKLYRSELKIETLMNFFAGIAVFVSLLGVFGLSSFAVEQKTKEIAIRKVLGAEFMGLFLLLTRSFVLLLVIGFALALPVTVLIMRDWLSTFKYAVDLGVPVFLLAGSLSIVATLLTVSYHAVRAVLLNPVVSLKYE